MRGFIHPPITGEYTFWIAADEAAIVFLSTDEDPENKEPLAFVLAKTDPQEWTKNDSQISNTVTLQAGQKYYIEALHKEDIEDDHLAISWAISSLPQQVIDGKYLSPPSGGAPYITEIQADTLNVELPAGTRVSVTTQDDDNDELKYSWSSFSKAVVFQTPNLPESQVSFNEAGTYQIDVIVSDGNGGVTTSSITVTATGWPSGRGNRSLLREWWTGIQGDSVESLTQNPNFPLSPTGVQLLNSFEAPTNWGDNYGQRLRGFLHPPVTGKYTFWIAADEHAELWLSTDKNPENKDLVASLTSATPPHQWTIESVEIDLEAGQKYYIEALHKEGTGSDHLAISWAVGHSPREIIDGQYLSSTDGTAPVITHISSSSKVVPWQSQVNVNVIAQDADGDELKYYWSSLSNDVVFQATNSPECSVSFNQPGDYQIDVTASDGNGGLASRSITVKASEWPNGLGSKSLLREWWTGIQGDSVENLTQHPNFPLLPTGVELLNSFEAPSQWGNNYGQRLRGFVRAPITGKYTFWIAADDNAELWLSTDENPENKRLTAGVIGWTYPDELDKYDFQESEPVDLVAGQIYYIEALHKEGAGGDHLAVSWEVGDLPLEIINGHYLSSTGGTTPVITRFESSASKLLLPGTVTVNVIAQNSDTDTDSDQLKYYWTSPSNNVIFETPNSPQSTVSFNQPGDYQLTVTVSNGDGGVVHESVTINTENAVEWTPGMGKNSLLREWWTGIHGNSAWGNLTNSPNFPLSPTGVEILDSFEAPANWGDNYGQRLKGFLHPPVTGKYTFWIAADSTAVFSLSTDENPENKQRLAGILISTEPREWDTNISGQKSVEVPLQAGQKYYIEALHHEKTGDDHLAVAWAVGNSRREIIKGQYLSSTNGTAPVITSIGATPMHVVHVTAEDVDNDELKYYWTSSSNNVIFETPNSLESQVYFNASGTYQLYVTVSDGNGGVTSSSVTVTIELFPRQPLTGWAQSPDSDASWSIANDEASEGLFSLKSDIIGPSQRAAIQYSGNFNAGQISFDRKLPSESLYNYLVFYIDDIEKGRWNGEVSWSKETYDITEGFHTFKWQFQTEILDDETNEHAWIDDVTLPDLKTPTGPVLEFIETMDDSSYVRGETINIVWGSYQIDSDIKIELLKNGELKALISDSTENDGVFDWVVPENFSVENYELKISAKNDSSLNDQANITIFRENFFTGWIQSPDSDISWTRVSDKASQGIFSLTPSAIVQDKKAAIEYSGNFEAGQLSFDKRVLSIGYGFDSLLFYIDGIEQGEWSGDIPWSKETYDITEGFHTFKWEYDKYFPDTSGNCWIDDVILPDLKRTGPILEFLEGSLHDSVHKEGETVNILWHSYQINDDIKIELLRDGDLKALIADNVKNKGMFDWVIPNDFATGNYVLRISAKNDPSISDQANITIAIERFPELPLTGWVQSPDSHASWSVVSDEASEGMFSLKSDIIGHSQKAAIQYSGNFKAGKISFDKKVSSEEGYDGLIFYIDDIQQESWSSGEVNWTNEIYDITEGFHTFKWQYEKDDSLSDGDDCAWIDNLRFPPRANNRPPVLNVTGSPSLTEIFANDVNSPGNTVGEIVIDGSITDPDIEGSAPESIVVTSVDNDNGGDWQVKVGEDWRPLYGNQAIYGEASQSSTHTVGGAASRAIDGNTNHKWSGGSVTHTATAVVNNYWQVQLDEVSYINEIIIYNRAEVSDRLTNFIVEIFKGNERVVTKEFEDTARLIETFSSLSVLGDRVKITLRSANMLSLAEVQVYGSRALEPTDRIRFVPEVDYTGDPSFTYRAFDGIDTSVAEETASITVRQPENSAPVLDISGYPSLTGILVNDVNSPGNTVGEIVIDDSITDPDIEGSAPESIVVTSVENDNGGDWQVKVGDDWRPLYGNQAIYGEASQSSTHTVGGAASRAIDGNTNHKWSGGSVTHTATAVVNNYWQVQLDEVSYINEIIIYNRAEVSDRLTNFIVEIFKGNERVETKTFENTASLIEVFTSLSVLGDRVKITLRSANMLSLAEVQVYGSRALKPTDRIRFVPKVDYTGGDPTFKYRAFDGIDTSIAEETASITVRQPENSAPVLDISGYPSLTGILVNDVNSPGNTVGEIVIDDSITDADIEGSAPESIVVTSVDHDNGGDWQVKVGEDWRPLYGNQAIYGEANQSSTRTAGGAASRAIDGNTNHNWSGGSVTHTATAVANNYWQVQLDEVSYINEIIIYNRAEVSERLTNFIVEIFKGDERVVAEEFEDTARLIETFSSLSVLGDRVKITLKSANILSLAEVEVYGSRALEPTDRIRFVPEVDYTGDPSFTYRAFDGIDTSVAEETASITVLGIWPTDGAGSGSILREWWTGISGDLLGNLIQAADFPLVPTGSDQRSSFEAPTNWGNDYGQRMRGFIHPPITGKYTFWIAGDNNCELWLSIDEDPENKDLLASITSWTGPRQWGKYDSQESVEVELQAGQKYYIEALHKEGGGPDNLAVAWEVNALPRKVIQGRYLSTITDTSSSNTPVLQQSEISNFNAIASSGSQSLIDSISIYATSQDDRIGSWKLGLDAVMQIVPRSNAHGYAYRINTGKGIIELFDVDGKKINNSSQFSASFEVYLSPNADPALISYIIETDEGPFAVTYLVGASGDAVLTATEAIIPYKIQKDVWSTVLVDIEADLLRYSDHVLKSTQSIQLQGIFEIDNIFLLKFRDKK